MCDCDAVTAAYVAQDELYWLRKAFELSRYETMSYEKRHIGRKVDDKFYV